MPSNKDLRAEASVLGKELKIDLVLTGLGNTELAKLVSDLKAKKRDAELTTQADDETEEAPAPPAPDEEAAAPPAPDETDKEAVSLYFIAPGKAITCRKGILSDGDPIEPEWIAGDESVFINLVNRGYIVKA